MPEKLAFYIQHPFHEAMLKPLWEAGRESFNCLWSSKAREVISFRPRVILHASAIDRGFRRYLPETYLVWVRHGFASKNFGMASVRHADIACHPSHWALDDFTRRGFKPRLDSWVTGFPPMDAAFRLNLGDKPDRKGLRKVLLYAPTFDRELSAHPVLGGSFAADLLERFPELEIWIKPHPHIPKLEPGWIDSLEEGAARRSRIRILPAGEDIYKILPEADILLSDCSSVFLYFLVFDRPVILVGNPLRFKSPKFDPHGPEWTFRSVAEEISALDELPAALGRALRDPSARGPERRKLASKVLGNTFDGRTSERIIERVAGLLGGNSKQRRGLFGLLEGTVLRFLPRYSLERIEEREE